MRLTRPEDETAIDIIRRHQVSAPVDVIAIADALGLRVQRRDLGDNVSGKIVRRVLGRYDIIVNEADHPRRQRFTVAHEIAHFILHRDLIGDDFEEDAMYRGPLGGAAETQANRLAADILMPHSLIRRYLQAGVTGAMELARQFEVSPKAMELRLEGLARLD